MSFFLYNFFEALLLVTALSIDAFFAGFSYGVKRIRIPFLSLFIINGMSGVVLLLCLLFGRTVGGFLTEDGAAWISFFLLFIVGLVKLFDGCLKYWIRKSEPSGKKWNFHLFDAQFILTVYADPDRADADKGGVLSAGEAVSLGVALSIDSAGAGIGAGVAFHSLLLPLLLSLVLGIIAVRSGGSLGKKVAQCFSRDLSWVSGLLLILLAFTKILK